MDGVVGLSDGVKSIFPNVNVQRCIVHLIRNSMLFIARKDYKEFTSDLKTIYAKSTNATEATEAFNVFERKWGRRAPGAVKVWKDLLNDVLNLFNFSMDIRKVIYTTNAIETLNSSLRKYSKGIKLKRTSKRR